jgi:hypothetical protein
VIYAIQTFAVARQHHEDFVHFVESDLWPVLEESGARRVGLWSVILGGPERLFMMTRYDDVGHWLDCQDWQSDYWQGRGRSELVENADAMIVRPITQTEPATAPEPEPGIYTVRTFQIDMRKDLDRFIDLSENKWWPWVKLGEGVRPVCQWATVIAEAPRIYMMTRYDDLSHWEGHQLGRERQSLSDPKLKAIYDEALVAIRQRSEIVRETSVKILRPLSRHLP